ncbi:hypothetical protein J6590_064541 [Homalodisca vitripennis]|nr:hypothetical protein J6590_064541 [Homalodisca vitripennis]
MEQCTPQKLNYIKKPTAKRQEVVFQQSRHQKMERQELVFEQCTSQKLNVNKENNHEKTRGGVPAMKTPENRSKYSMKVSKRPEKRLFPAVYPGREGYGPLSGSFIPRNFYPKGSAGENPFSGSNNGLVSDLCGVAACQLPYPQ